jgi:membrane protease YdiL (CAAX protease family)
MKRWLAFIALVFLGELYNFAHSDLQWVMAVAGFLAIAPVISRWAGVGGYRELGLFRHARWGSQLGFGLLAGGLAGTGAYLLEWSWSGAQLSAIHWGALGAMLYAVVIGSFLGALVEELFFRGYLLRILPPSWSPKLATFVGALLFAAGHWHRWGVRPLEHFFFLFILGLALVVPAQRTGSLWLSIGLHAGHNLGVNTLSLRTAFPVAYPAVMPWAAGHVYLLMAALLIPAGWWLSREPAPPNSAHL